MKACEARVRSSPRELVLFYFRMPYFWGLKTGKKTTVLQSLVTLFLHLLRLREHVEDSSKNPILIFPEGRWSFVHLRRNNKIRVRAAIILYVDPRYFKSWLSQPPAILYPCCISNPGYLEPRLSQTPAVSNPGYLILNPRYLKPWLSQIPRYL